MSPCTQVIFISIFFILSYQYIFYALRDSAEAFAQAKHLEGGPDEEIEDGLDKDSLESGNPLRTNFEKDVQDIFKRKVRCLNCKKSIPLKM